MSNSSTPEKKPNKRFASEIIDDLPPDKKPKLSPSELQLPTEKAQTSSQTNLGMRLLQMSGFVEGTGLGLHGQGIREPIEAAATTGRRGLGHEANKVDADAEYDADSEIKSVEEEPTWVKRGHDSQAYLDDNLSYDWIKVTEPKMTIDDEDRYCARELISQLLDAKNVFDTIPRAELNEARARANPYETIKAGFFQNRAAMKTANIDKIYKWKLSREFEVHRRLAKNPLESGKQRLNTDRQDSLFYFADVCAGPGGFSEYMLWRKAFYNAKGFGFTLTGRDDFKLEKFKASSPEYFETFYGVKNNGDVMDPENLASLEKFIHERTRAPGSKTGGVHLTMCDGGFSVEGQENLQEILSKRLYLCQFIVGLSLCRIGNERPGSGGNFFCKLFDVFTPFSVGLVYLMYAAFDRISIHKPITSRPANSERYIFCENLTEFGATRIKDYLLEVNNRLEEFEPRGNNKSAAPKTSDVYEIVPQEVIERDEEFSNYIRQSNETIARRQIFYLRKYQYFKNKKGAYDKDQANIRDDCSRYWELPNIERILGGALRDDRGNPQHRPPMMVLNKFAPEQIHFPLKRTSKFGPEMLGMLKNPAEELRAILLTELSEPMLLVSNGGAANVFTLKRQDSQFELLAECSPDLPNDTILLVQITELYRKKEETKIESVGKVIYVVDAAVLNGDDVSQLELKFRLAAARKFVAAINKRYVKRPIFQRQNYRDKNPNRRQQFVRYETVRGYELICAEPHRLPAMHSDKFTAKGIKGARTALFPVRSEIATNLESEHFLACRGIRIVNIFNSSRTSNSSSNSFYGNEGPLSPGGGHVQQSNFYEQVNGIVGSNMPMKSTVVSWFWSWEPDYQTGFGVDNILNDEECHKSGAFTLKWLGKRLAQIQPPKEEPKHELEEEPEEEEYDDDDE